MGGLADAPACGNLPEGLTFSLPFSVELARQVGLNLAVASASELAERADEPGFHRSVLQDSPVSLKLEPLGTGFELLASPYPPDPMASTGTPLSQLNGDINIIHVGSAVPGAGSTLETILAPLTVDAGGSADTPIIDASGAAGALAGAVDERTVAGFGGVAPITYEGLAELRLRLGSGADEVTVESTHEGLTVIDGGGSADAFAVRTAVGAVSIRAGSGDDVVRLGMRHGGHVALVLPPVA